MKNDLNKHEIWLHYHSFIFILHRKDTRIVAVNVAVIQDEGDAFKFSHLWDIRK